MTYWLIALVVWISAGARIGRVLVRPATTVRMAIVVAVAAVAAASTTAIPDIAQAIDSAAQLKVYDPRLSDAQAVACWVIYTTATSIVAFAAWPIASRRNLWHVAVGIYLVGIVFAVLSLTLSPTLGWLVVAIGSVFIAVTGLRNLNWSPLGRGIAIYTTGAVIIAILSIFQARRVIIDDSVAARHPEPAWAWSLAAMLTAVGAVSILIEVWFRSRLLMRRLRPLHRVLIDRFPEVVVDDDKRTTTVLRASDHVAQIMDALYLQAGGGAGIAVATAPPTSAGDRAAVVAQWARHPESGLLDPRWIAPPEGTSTRRWVSAIAQAFVTSSGARHAVVPG